MGAPPPNDDLLPHWPAFTPRIFYQPIGAHLFGRAPRRPPLLEAVHPVQISPLRGQLCAPNRAKAA